MSADLPKIVVAEKMSDWAIERLREVGQVEVLPGGDETALLAEIRDAEALVVRTYTQVTEAVIKVAGRLRVIGRAGIGVENIATSTAQDRGIVVVHTPAASTQAVAELTIGLMISLIRRTTWAEQQLRTGRFLQAREQLASPELKDLTLGIVGLGRIGSRVAETAHQALCMNIVFNDIREIRPLRFAARPAELEELLEQADVVSLHVPLTTRTRQMIGADRLDRLKSPAWLINTARGAVVDTAALVNALHNGRLAGAALDVTDPEPLPEEHPLLETPHCIITPHIGSRTNRSQEAMNRVVEDVIAVLQNRSPQYPYQE